MSIYLVTRVWRKGRGWARARVNEINSKIFSPFVFHYMFGVRFLYAITYDV